MKSIFYRVAGHRFCISLPDNDTLWDLMEPQYGPFVTEKDTDGTAFHLTLTDNISSEGAVSVFKEEAQEDVPQIEIFRTNNGWIIKSCCTICVSEDWKEAEFTIDSADRLYCMNNAAMMLYAFSTAGLGTLEMHASVVSNSGKAFLFLARSGTGKSTHSQMWMKAVPGTELVNDDNPVVRFFPDGSAKVYGSPWSGKTPCYRNVEYPIGAFVHIRRADYNKCTRMDTLQAYATIHSSASGFKAHRPMGDALHETASVLATDIPCFAMECMANTEAALKCSEAVL